MFDSRKSSHYIDHSNRVSGREARRASGIQSVIAGLSCTATPQVTSVEMVPTTLGLVEPVRAPMPLVYLQEVA